MTRYRARQLFRHLVAPDPDTSHAERTAALLRAYGADEELVEAGLIHDIAKPAGTRLWHRVAAVLLERLAATLARRLARGDGTLARYLDHAARGAEAARREGRSPRVVRLVLRHHQTPRSDDEALLARADREAVP